MTLYHSRNYNPRLAVAVGRYLDAPIAYEFAEPLVPANRDRFLPLNPNLRLPILIEEDGSSLWEADAIACRLSQLVGSDFWRTGAALPEMILWLSWANSTFVPPCDKVQFERVTKQRYALGPIREDLVAEGLADFASAASLLDARLATRNWLMDDGLSYADFRMACVLPSADLAGLPTGDYRNISAWYDRLTAIPAWRDPFEGLDAPPLPPVPPQYA
ncbi:MAG TPA: glutathione S-transferase family protein [Devosia sp.]|nr:glutathione S-transferase family protein [Devosia sp.]